MSKANNLVPLVTVILSRKIDGVQKRIKPQIGKVFEFTDEEIKDITGANPNALRKPINESQSELVEAKTGSQSNSGDTGKSQEQITAETKEVIKTLVGGDFEASPPNMEVTNKALKAAGLPNDLKAADRDAVIAQLKSDAEQL